MAQNPTNPQTEPQAPSSSPAAPSSKDTKPSKESPAKEPEPKVVEPPKDPITIVLETTASHIVEKMGASAVLILAHWKDDVKHVTAVQSGISKEEVIRAALEATEGATNVIRGMNGARNG